MSKLIDRITDKVLFYLLNRKNQQEADKYVKGIDDSFARLKNKVQLSVDQTFEIQDFFSRYYQKAIPISWHRYFTSRLGEFSAKYIPTSLYKTDIIGRLNIYPLKRAYTDKNITDIILPADVQPKVHIKNMNGYFYSEGEAISKDKAVELCSNLGAVIIKPSLTGRGVGVRKLEMIDGVDIVKQQSIESIFDEYKTDFLVEELIEQHELMARLNPSSVNTIRIVTYRSGMDVAIVYTVVRIGRKDHPIDNESAGGISARINNDGCIAKYAYGAPGVDKVEFTDNGMRIEGYPIPFFADALSLVKKLHFQLPYFNLVGWDIAITKDEKPVLIEFNMTPDLSQSANGPAFGDLTEQILKDAMSHKNTWSWMGQKSMWKKR